MRATEFITESATIFKIPEIKNNANATSVIRFLFNKESNWKLNQDASIHKVASPQEANFIIGPRGAVFFYNNIRFIVKSINNTLTTSNTVKPNFTKIEMLVGSPFQYYKLSNGNLRQVPRPESLFCTYDPGFQKLYTIVVDRIYNHYALVGEVPDMLEQLYNDIPVHITDPNKWGDEFYKTSTGPEILQGVLDKFMPDFYNTMVQAGIDIPEDLTTSSTYAFNATALYAVALKADKQLLYKELANFLRKFIIVFIS